MKKPNIPDGLWPVMLTPFTEDGQAVDYAGLEQLIEWYLANGVDGLFAVCQSSEMYYLSREERKAVAAFVVKTVNGRVPVIASGHVSDTFEDQVRDVEDIWSTGVEAVVLLPNRFAAADEPESVFLANLERFLNRISADIPLGMYECPAPYKRVLTPESTAFCANSGRFFFLKDTCCNLDQIKAKLSVCEGKGFKIFNANSAQLLDSVKAGCAGFSGVMMNFHPDLYRKMLDIYKTDPKGAARLQNFLGLASCIEPHGYPICSKRYLKKYVLPGIHTTCRVKPASGYIQSFDWELDELHALTEEIRAEFCNK